MPVHELHTGSQPAETDTGVRWLISLVCLVSVVSFAYFSRKGEILAYQDAISHMEIARRVIDSPTTGFGQLGGVWLPLPHLLMLPFIWENQLYYSGYAGSFISMASFVVAAAYIYKIVLSGTGKKTAALVAAAVFVGNPNVLYMQSTPMSEMLLIACMAAMAFYVQQWIMTDRYQNLIQAGVAGLLGTLTRYEAWVILVAFVFIVLYAAWRKGYGRSKTEGFLLAFLFVAGLGIVGWLAWNQLIFGNALNFQNGRYAKPSLWVGSSDIAVGSWLVALKTYAYATLDNLQWPLVAVMAAGMVAMVVVIRLGKSVLPVLALLVPFPFFVMALEKGQRPLHVMQLNGSLYNVRFGLLMVLPAAVLAGCAAGFFRNRWLTLLACVAIIGAVGSSYATDFRSPETDIATLREPLSWQQDKSSDEVKAGRYFHQHYRGGKILAQFFGNENVLFTARIDLKNNIYEGSFNQWDKALANPDGRHIQWIVMHRVDTSDEVTSKLRRSKELERFYVEVYRNNQYVIYERI